jgi:hypothetical protein
MHYESADLYSFNPPFAQTFFPLVSCRDCMQYKPLKMLNGSKDIEHIFSTS